MNNFLPFPKDFLFGSAVSGHQIEGGNTHSDWWHWELATNGQPLSGEAVDHWNRFEEDYDLLEAMGHQALRFGIEWARVEPNPGEFDQQAIDRYRQMLQSLKRRNIKICLTLHHWVLPQWVAEKGDWLNPEIVENFSRFASVIVKELGSYPDLWITLNEPMVALLASNLSGDFPPQRRSFRAFRKAGKHMLQAHAETYQMIHQQLPDAKVGIAMNYPDFQCWSVNEPFQSIIVKFGKELIYRCWDKSIVSGKLHPFFGTGRIAGLRNSIDFCGLNYYFRLSIKLSLKHWKTGFVSIGEIPNGIQTTDLNWQIWPQGLNAVLKEVWHRYRKPIYITENGLADKSDTKRGEFIKQHLIEVHNAITEGIPVKGYFHWSLIDNFEWKEGFKMCFGLVEVDFDDPNLARKPRPSAAVYSDIIAQNGIHIGESQSTKRKIPIPTRNHRSVN